ncbi:MAG: hypothetical protein IH977_16730 [Nitrospinae bacterium]|nr:hypothetical protein [Nitrospinota bacterium]
MSDSEDQTDETRQSWIERHSGALIGAAAVIIAAIIAGLFTLTSQNTQSPSITPHDEVTAITSEPESTPRRNTETSRRKSAPTGEQVSPNDRPTLDLDTYKAIYDFAYSGIGMNLNRTGASEFADSWSQNCQGESVEKFMEAYRFAYSGMNLNRTGAREWATQKFPCLQHR